MSQQRAIGQPALLRELNDRSALTLLLQHGPLTRNEIASRTGLSKPTAAEIIRRLEAAALIRECGEETGKRGPNAALYEAIVDTTLAVAIGVQGSLVHSRVVTAGSRLYAAAEHRMDAAERNEAGVEIVRAAIDRAVAAAGVDRTAVVAACVGVQGSVDPATDSLFFADTLENWPQQKVAETLSRELGIDVAIENDANLAAIVERNEGIAKEVASFALVWLAEGVGLALDLGSGVYRGSSGGAGEVGYLGLTAAARELEPTGTSLADLECDAALIRLGIRYGLLSDGATVEDWHSLLDAIQGLDEGHPFLTAVAERIVHVITPALAVTDPECVVLHGPTGVAGGHALARATAAALRRSTPWRAQILPPGVTDTPVLRGAVELLVEKLRQVLSLRIEDISDVAAPSRNEDAPAMR